MLNDLRMLDYYWIISSPPMLRSSIDDADIRIDCLDTIMPSASSESPGVFVKQKWRLRIGGTNGAK